MHRIKAVSQVDSGRKVYPYKQKAKQKGDDPGGVTALQRANAIWPVSARNNY